jgi:glycogen(starch) synthase
MRLALVAGDYAGISSFTGGIGGLYAMLCPELVRLGHEVRAVIPADGDARRLDRDGVQIETVALAGPAHARPLAWGLAADRALRRRPADLVLAAEYTAGAWRHARRRVRTPLVTHLHTSVAQVSRLSGWSRRQRALPLNALQSRLERDQTRRSDALLAPTRSILDWTRRLWDVGELPAAVVPNAVDVDRVRRLAAAGAPPEPWPDGPVVLFAGRLEPRKGVHVLAEAMRQVWREDPAVTLVLAGPDDGFRGGWMSAYVREAAGAFADRVRHVGVLPPERLYPALAAAEVVALPSLWENFSITALEAMAAGAPLVASAAGGFPEFTRPDEDAVLVPAGDSAALGAALLGLLRDPERRRSLGTRAAEGADRFRAATIAPRFAAELERLAGQPLRAATR